MYLAKVLLKNCLDIIDKKSIPTPCRCSLQPGHRRVLSPTVEALVIKYSHRLLPDIFVQWLVTLFMKSGKLTTGVPVTLELSERRLAIINTLPHVIMN